MEIAATSVAAPTFRASSRMPLSRYSLVQPKSISRRYFELFMCMRKSMSEGSTIPRTATGLRRSPMVCFRPIPKLVFMNRRVAAFTIK